MTRRQAHLVLLGIVVLAVALRGYHVGRPSFWYDEGASAYMAEHASLGLWMGDVHPPLYYTLLTGWRIFSETDAWLRLLSVVLGVATIPIVYALAAALFSRPAGLWAAFLLAVTYSHVKYSQEARMYALMVLLFAGACWGLVVGARQGRRRGWVTYVICATLLMYSQALGPLYLAVLLVLFPMLVPSPDRARTWRTWGLSNAIVGLLFLPWLAIFVRHTREVASSFWIAPASPEPPLFTTLHYLTVATIPPLSAMLRGWFGLSAGSGLGRWVWFAPILVTLAWILARAIRESSRPVGALVAAYVMPIVTLTIVSLIVAPVLIPRVLLPTVIPVVLLLAAGADLLSPRRLLNHAVLATVAGIPLLATLSYHRWAEKEDWREVSHYLGRQVNSTDLLVLDSDGARVPPYLLKRYDADGRLGSLPQLSVAAILARCGDDPGPCLNRGLAPYQPGQIAWLVHSHTEFVQGHDKVQRWLDGHFQLLASRPFEGVSVERSVLRSKD